MKKAHIISHVHWDREWRYPIWQTRLMLVEFMDGLIDVLEKGIYKGLVLDGQVIAIEDYLEFKPENRTRLKNLISAGKLDIGPWYTLPDEYPVDGECLVRNLLVGICKAQAFGKAFMVGYTSFGWGQTSQLPQIYNGFGISIGMIGKGPSPERVPNCEFIWRGPDGSQLLTTRFGQMGRHNFFLGLYLSMLFGTDYTTDNWSWSSGGTDFHRCEPEQKEQDHFCLNKPQKWHPEYITMEVLDKIWDTMQSSLLKDNRSMMNGCDYAAVQELLPEMVQKINEIDKVNGREWQQCKMSDYVGLLEEKCDRKQLITIEGELRDGPAYMVTGNALATHMDVKRLNKQAQNILIRFAEPLSVLVDDGSENFLEKAWIYLLQSHPHDSINGVTQDKTIEDVKSRLRHVIELSQSVGNKALQKLTVDIDCSMCGENEIIIVAVNPLPYPRSDVVEAYINMPDTSPKFELWPSVDKGLIVYDADNVPMGTQWQGVARELYPVTSLHSRAFPYACLQHHIYFDTGTIPAGGYKTFTVRPLPQKINTLYKSMLVETGSIKVDDRTIENEYLIVSMNSDGSFNLEAKELGMIFRNLNYYQDRGEAGDFWINRPPAFDKVISSLGLNASIWTEEAGPLQATLVAEIKMAIPSRVIKSEQQRSSDTRDLIIRTYITLKAHSRQVDVRIQFDNVCQDHYLRVMFPTGMSNAMYADSGGHFTVDHRSVRPQGPGDNKYWPDMATLPTNNFVDISDGKFGFALIHSGFTEYEVSQDSKRTLALTLLKAVQTWICTESRVGSVYPSQKAGQCLGTHEYSYAIRPHRGSWIEADIFNQADMFNSPIKLVQTNKHSGRLPFKEHSLFSISNSLIRFSALKYSKSKKSCILRLYNPTPYSQQATTSFTEAIDGVWETELDEKRRRPIEVFDKLMYKVTLEPFKIGTYEIIRDKEQG